MILVLGGVSYQEFFSKFGDVTTNWKDINWGNVKLCVFTGGEDVHPSYYGEEQGDNTYTNISRDKFEKVIFDTCVKNDIPMVGICRGAQFLTVMNGGRLHQHVNNHTIGHMIKTLDGKEFYVSSTHHQMMRPWLCKNFEVLATANQWTGDDPEVVRYNTTRSLAIQYHPEFMGATSEGVVYASKLIEELVA